MRADELLSAPAGVGVFTTDHDLVVVSWDSWMEQHSAISAATAIGTPLTALVPDLATRRLLARFEHVLEQGVVEVLSPAFHRYLLRCSPSLPSAHFQDMQQRVTIAPLRSDEQITGTIVTIEDVTARLDRERELASQLKSSNPATRLEAAENLDANNEHDAALLKQALRDDQWRVRRAAAAGVAAGAGRDVIADVLRSMRDQHQDLALLNSVLQVLTLTEIDVVGPLVEFLGSPDDDLRIYAALALADQHDPRVVTALIAALDDPDQNVRFHAIEALGKLRAQDAVEPLVAIAETRDFFLAFPAIDAIRLIGDPDVAPRLVPLLRDDLLRGAVADALGALGDESVVAPLAHLLNSSADPAPVVAHALDAVHRRYESAYGEGSYIADLARRTFTPAATQHLLDALETAQCDELRSMVVVLGWLHGSGVQRALARLLDQAAVRPEVITALVRFGGGVTKLLIEQLDAADVETRVAAVIALGRIGDTSAVPALIELLETDPELQVAVADALAKLGDHRAFDALLQRIGHRDVAVRQAAIAALNSLGHPDLETQVAARLTDADPLIRESAVRIAGYFGFPSCGDAILSCTDDRVDRVRQAAVEVLPYLDDPRCLPRLLDVLANDTPAVRAAAVRALGQMEAPAALPHLIQALEDIHPWVRYFAACSLGQQRSPESAEVLTRILRTDPATQVRIAAAEALGHIGGAQVVAALVLTTAEADIDLATNAIKALGATRDPLVLPTLHEALRASDSARRRATIGALARHGDPSVVQSIQWVAAADADVDIQQTACDALGRIETPEAIAALIELLLNTNQREAVINVLTRAARPFLAELGRGLSHPHVVVREAVVQTLARMRRPAATQIIVSALDDPEPTVRLAAVQALRHLGARAVQEKLAQRALVDSDLRVRRAIRPLLNQ